MLRSCKQAMRVPNGFRRQADIGPHMIVQMGQFRLILCQGTSPDIGGAWFA